MKIYLAADHAGFELKEKVKGALAKEGHEITDFGANELKPEDDYPDFMWKAAENISKDYTQGETNSRAILFGGSGQGEAMIANRFSDVRAAVYYGGDTKILKLSREHNDANTLAIGARFVNEKEAMEAIDLWLKTDFSNEERHRRRIAKIEDYPAPK